MSDPAAPLVIRVPGPMRGKVMRKAQWRPGGVTHSYPDPQTAAVEARIAWYAKLAMAEQGATMLSGAVELTVRVTVMVPQSWSKRKQAEALAGHVRPTSKPDCSNYCKACEDALNQIVFRDDAQITDLHVHKHYGTEPGAVLEVRPL